MNNAVTTAGTKSHLGLSAANSQIVTPVLELHASDLSIMHDKLTYIDQMIYQFLARFGGEHFGALPLHGVEAGVSPARVGKMGIVADQMQALKDLAYNIEQRAQKLGEIA